MIHQQIQWEPRNTMEKRSDGKGLPSSIINREKRTEGERFNKSQKRPRCIPERTLKPNSQNAGRRVWGRTHLIRNVEQSNAYVANCGYCRVIFDAPKSTTDTGMSIPDFTYTHI